MSWNSTVRCSWCNTTGHNRRGCDDRQQHIADHPDSYEARQQAESSRRSKKRVCSYCNACNGHNRRTCPVLGSDKIFLVETLRTVRPRLLEKFKEIGFGIGALIRDEYWGYTCLVNKIEWENLDQRHVPLDPSEQPYGSMRIDFLATNVKDGKTYRLSMNLDGLAKNILSPTNKNGRCVSAGWSGGTIYNQERWFDKQSSRDYFFIENNPFSS